LDSIKKYICHKDFALGYLTIADFIIAERAYYFEALYPKEIVEF
jgi:hypothetical protein